MAVGLLTAGAAAVLPSAAAFAAGGYGPAAPTGPAGTPGGYSAVVTVKTVDAAGGRLAARIAGASVRVNVPADAFAAPVQVEVTKPVLGSVNHALGTVGFSGYRAVAGIGVKVLNANGKPYEGTFAKPVDVTLTGARLGVAGEKVLELDGSSAATVLASTPGHGAVSVRLVKDPNLAVINPDAASAAPVTSGTIAGATTSHTGKAFAGESALGGLLVLGGAGALAAATARRRKAVAAK